MPVNLLSFSRCPSKPGTSDSSVGASAPKISLIRVKKRRQKPESSKQEPIRLNLQNKVNSYEDTGEGSSYY
jgi:hypothetical protein